MSKKMGLIVALIALSVGGFKSTHECDGIIEENDARIPVGTMNAQGAFTGISQETYNQILDRMEQLYSDDVAARGGKLQIVRPWDDETVNAYAQKDFFSNAWKVTFPGGLPRHPAITADGFALVACHEIGHHLGGYPVISGWMNDGMAIEGQADYFANTKCLREYFTPETNKEWFANNEADPVALAKCQSLHPNDENAWMTCARGAMAGMSVSVLFQQLRNEEVHPDFSTPDQKSVNKTNTEHPATQCRLDTYYQGSLCLQNKDIAFSGTEEHTGACTAKQGFTEGFRPLCWFKPKN